MFRSVCVVTMLLVMAGSASGYEILTKNAPTIHPQHPWYDEEDPANSSQVLVTVSGTLKITTVSEATSGGSLETRIMDADCVVDDILALVEVDYRAAPIGTTVTYSGSTCLWFNATGHLTGPGGSSSSEVCDPPYEIAFDFGALTENSPETIVVPTLIDSAANYYDCSEPPRSAPSSSVVGKVALALLLLSAGGWAAVLYRRRRLAA